MIKCIIFDLDDTLYDYTLLNNNCYDKVIEKIIKTLNKMLFICTKKVRF